MLKKLQSLKAKKGFTLVELIVVIAIIAVLAAILVPTMLGYVTSSRVTSADSTAASLKDSLGNAIVETDTKGESVPRAGSFTVEPTVAGDGKVSAIVFKDASGSPVTTYNKLGDALKDKINDDYNFTKEWVAMWYVKDGKVVGCAYSAETGATVAIGESSFTSGHYGWANTDGIDGDGHIVGTSPKCIKS